MVRDTDSYQQGNKELLEWLENSLKRILPGRPAAVALAARYDASGDVITAYFQCSLEDMAVIEGHIRYDAVQRMIDDNLEDLQDEMEGGE